MAAVRDKFLVSNLLTYLLQYLIRRSQHSKSTKPTPALFLCLVTLNLNSFKLKINAFPGLMVEHVYLKLGHLSWSSFLDFVRNN